MIIIVDNFGDGDDNKDFALANPSYCQQRLQLCNELYYFGWTLCGLDNPGFQWFNKLASLEATLGRNSAQPATDWQG